MTAVMDMDLRSEAHLDAAPDFGCGDPADSHDSSSREKLLEYLFISDLLRCLWRQGRRQVELLRADVDNAGYDLVLECDGVMRHVQLKSSHLKAKTDRVNINRNLAQKPAGCVIWMQFDPTTLELGPFLWFGASPDQKLPALGVKVGRHSRGKKDLRRNIRVLRKGRFTVLPTMETVCQALFDNSGP